MTRILVIEDETSLRDNLQLLLEAEGLQFLGAPDGHGGVQAAREHLPDLILCDIMMPELDGYGVLAALRQDPVTATIPFIFLTAMADKADRRQGMELGADDYLTKPFTRDELLKAIRMRLEKQAGVERKFRKQLEELRGSLAMSLPHELRTPLVGILSGAALLKEDFNTLERRDVLELVDIIHASAVRLQRLVTNYLLYADLELMAADPQEIRITPEEGADPQALITRVAMRVAQRFGRPADLYLQVAGAVALISEEHLQKIVEELLDNAFKFSTAGTAVHVIGVVACRQYALSIVDHGRGMTAEQIAGSGAYVQFERKHHEQQGAGLGLAIARRLTELYGGQLSIASIHGQRTYLCVTLPVVDGSGAP
jgi:two-component system sensor histidine kinase/response regulator